MIYVLAENKMQLHYKDHNKNTKFWDNISFE
jgi:hypothetical protein